jgi:hypothetical protein
VSRTEGRKEWRKEGMKGIKDGRELRTEGD